MIEVKSALLWILIAATLAAASPDWSVMVRETPSGVFMEQGIPVPGETPTVCEGTDDQVLWHYSQTEGLTQKICHMGNAGEYVFTGGWYGGGRMFQGLTGDGSVLWQTEPVLGENEYWTLLATGTAAADTGDLYWLVRTFSIYNDNGTPGYTPDDSLVSENNLEVCLFQGASEEPLWTWNGTGQFQGYNIDSPGKCDCSADGSVFALGGAVDGHLALAFFHSDTPEPFALFQETGTSYAPRQLRMTSDGSKAIFSVGATLYRVDAATGTLEANYSLGASTDCFGISADGSLVAFGFTAVKLAQWDGQGYTPVWSRNVSGYYAGAAAVSDDNQTVYYGLHNGNYTSNRILRFDADSSDPVWTYDYPAGSGSKQDLVSWMDCSSDGRWLAVSSWGCETGGGDEVMVFDDCNPGSPVFSIDTPGSMFHVDISPDGSLVTAAGKHVHANMFGSGTDVYMAEITTTGIGGESAASPGMSVAVGPNPCTRDARVYLSLAAPETVRITVFDLAGRTVEEVFHGPLGAGEHAVAYSHTSGTGLFLVRVSLGNEVRTARLLVVP